MPLSVRSDANGNPRRIQTLGGQVRPTWDAKPEVSVQVLPQPSGKLGGVRTRLKVA